MAISAAGNVFLTEARLDGKLLASDPDRCRAVLSTALNLVYLLSALLEPFLPSVAEDIQRILNAPARRIPFSSWSPSEGLLDGHQIGQPFHLFNKLDETFLAELRVRFAGKQ
jgi:methionyl-tRNA synthetase